MVAGKKMLIPMCPSRVQLRVTPPSRVHTDRKGCTFGRGKSALVRILVCREGLDNRELQIRYQNQKSRECNTRENQGRKICPIRESASTAMGPHTPPP